MIIGRLSQRKAIQRLGGNGAATAALFTALGFGPSGVGALSLSRFNSDGKGGPLSGYSLTSQGAVVPAVPPNFASLSPDGLWLICYWSANSTPRTQIYKRRNAGLWSYFNELPSAPAAPSVNNDCVNGLFHFSSDSSRIVMSAGGGGPGSYQYWDLVSGAWLYQGTVPNFGYGSAYAESGNGLLKVQTQQSNNGLAWTYNNGSLTLLNQGSMSGIRLYVSPLGTRIAQFGYQGGGGVLFRYFFDGSSVGYAGLCSFGFPADASSLGVWLSEDILAFGSRRITLNLTSGTSYPTTHIYLVNVSTGAFSTIAIDSAVYVNSQQSWQQFDAVADVAAVAPGILGYLTQNGVIGTVNYTGTTLTSVGPAVSIRQPKLALGAAILRVP